MRNLHRSNGAVPTGGPAARFKLTWSQNAPAVPERDAAEAYAMHAAASNGFGDADLGRAATTIEVPGPLLMPNVDEGYAKRLVRFAASAIRALRAAAPGVAGLWSRHRQLRDACLALRDYDVRMLRDIGLHRSEIASITGGFAGEADSSGARSMYALRATLC